MPSAERLSLKFHSCPRSFASLPTVHLFDDLSALPLSSIFVPIVYFIQVQTLAMAAQLVHVCRDAVLPNIKYYPSKYRLVHNWVRRGRGPILICVTSSLCKHACKNKSLWCQVKNRPLCLLTPLWNNWSLVFQFWCLLQNQINTW